MSIQEKVKDFVSANHGFIEAERKKEGFRWTTITDLIGIDSIYSEYARSYYKRWRQKNPSTVLQGAKEYKEFIKESGEIEITELLPQRLSDDQLYSRYNRDPKNWTIKTIWYKDQSNGVKLSVCFAPRREVVVDYTGKFLEFLKTYQPKPFEFKEEKKQENTLSMLSLADLHIGKYQNEHYLPKLLVAAAQMLKSLTNTQELIILNTGDYFHTDNVNGTTTKGTQLETSNTFERSFTVGLSFITSIINLAKELLPTSRITLINVRGNHDYSVSFCLGEAIKALFAKDDQVKIINESSSRIYYYWNNNAFLFTHGDKAVDRLPLIFATEGNDYFSKATHRHIYIGHFHYNNNKKFLTDQNEDMGIQMRILASPSKTDTWHHQNGFVENTKPLTLISFNKNGGKYAEFTQLIT